MKKFLMMLFGMLMSLQTVQAMNVDAFIDKNIAPYIEKCICFEYPFFAKGAEKADALRTKLFQ